MLEWPDPPYTAGHWIPDQIEAAGGEPVLAHPGGRSSATSWEAVAESEADVLIVAPCGFDQQAAEAQLAEHVDDPILRSFFTQSLDLKEKKWRLNLDVLAQEMPKILNFPEVSGQYLGPTLFLSGADSDYVKREYRPEIKALFPNAGFLKIPGAGHWLHAEKPREFEAAVKAWLERENV